ncbi:MAG: SHOCT domain-containing protein [Eubacteriales bacterium]
MNHDSDRKLQEAKARLRKAQQEADEIHQNAGGSQTISSADELKKFKELLDSGVITQEEFEAKKKQLLGL